MEQILTCLQSSLYNTQHTVYIFICIGTNQAKGEQHLWCCSKARLYPGVHLVFQTGSNVIFSPPSAQGLHKKVVWCKVRNCRTSLKSIKKLLKSVYLFQFHMTYLKTMNKRARRSTPVVSGVKYTPLQPYVPAHSDVGQSDTNKPQVLETNLSTETHTAMMLVASRISCICSTWVRLFLFYF